MSGGRSIHGLINLYYGGAYYSYDCGQIHISNIRSLSVWVMATTMMRVLGISFPNKISSMRLVLVEHVLVGERVAWGSMLWDRIIEGFLMLHKMRERTFDHGSVLVTLFLERFPSLWTMVLVRS